MSLLQQIYVRAPVVLGTGESMDAGSLRALRSMVPNVPCFRIDNVSVYWAEHKDADVVLTAPSLRPPFDATWFESVRPPRLVTPTGIMGADHLPPRWGGMMHVAPEGNGWRVLTQVFAQIGASAIPVEVGGIEWRLDDAGKMLSDPFGHGAPMQVYAPPGTDKDPALADRYSEILDHVTQPMRLAIGFMHCKNVLSREVPANRGERRAAERGGAPRVTFRELVIQPTPKSRAEPGAPSGKSRGVSLHICRGHFVTYDERPLFGKYRGTYWVPAHVRGSSDVGMVHKSYEVRPPRKPEGA